MCFESRDKNSYAEIADIVLSLLARFWETNLLDLNCIKVGRDLMTMGEGGSQGQTNGEPVV